jgi:phospholipid-binding lipoprotein MlaA
MMRNKLIGLILVVIALALGGCSTTQVQGGPGGQPVSKADPWENWNRKVFALNDGLDRAVLKPVATGYAAVMPQFVRTGVDNFFGNFGDAWSAVNNVLQGKGQPAFEDVVRVTTNTVIGFFGILDIASEFGLKHRNEDFGQTLGHWGVGPGPYVVLPVLGPSTLRDTAALPVDRYYASPTNLLGLSGLEAAGITTLQVVNTRANLLGASKLLDGITLDKYTFIRDAHLQRRRNAVYDGDPPEVPDEPEAGVNPDLANPTNPAK